MGVLSTLQSSTAPPVASCSGLKGDEALAEDLHATNLCRIYTD